MSRGDVADGLMVGMPAGPVTISTTGNAAALALGPTTACTPSCSTRCRAARTAGAGLRVASAVTPCTGRPSTPPPSFRGRMARSKARFRSADVSGAPEKSSSRPILIGSEPSAQAQPGAQNGREQHAHGHQADARRAGNGSRS